MSAAVQLVQDEQSDSPEIELEAKLYGGSVTIKRTVQHTYLWAEKGYYIPGVTSILGILDKPALMPWAAKMATEYVKAHYKEGMPKAELEALCDLAKGEHRRKKEEAGDYGSQVHDLANKVLRGIPVKLPDPGPVLNGFNAFQEWLSANDVKVIDTECICFSKSAFFAGAFDLLAAVNGLLTKIDFKTSSGVYKDHKMQLGGYKYAWEEEHNGERIEQLGIIHLDKKNGKMKPYLWSDPAEMQLFTDSFLRVKAASDIIKKVKDF